MKIIATTRGVLPLAVFGALLAGSSDATACKRLTDKDNTFLSSLMLLGNITAAEADSVQLETMFGPVDKMFPWLSSCVASLEPITLMASVAANPSYTKCMSEKKAEEEHGDHSGKGGDDGKAMTDTEIRERVCVDYDRQVMGCLKDVLIPAAASTMATNPCCTDMKNTISTSFGTDLVSMANVLFRQIGNVICTTKTYTNSENKQVTESCGHSLMSALFMAGPDNTMSNAIQMMQVPSDQVCKAMTGQPFTTTTGETTKFDWSKGGVEGVGICYQPVGQLVDTVSQYPVVKTTTATVDGASVPMSDLFTSGKCLSGQVVVKWLLADDGMLMKLAQLVDDTNAVVASILGMGPDQSKPDNATLSGSSSNATEDMGMLNMTTVIRFYREVLAPVAPTSCVHLPSGVSNCDFGTASLSLAYKEPTTSAPTPAPTEAKSSAVPFSSAGMLTLAAVVASTMAQFLL